MTAPISKSKTKNYRLLTVGALRPHIGWPRDQKSKKFKNIQNINHRYFY